jgi:hypothetical protein
MGHLKLTPPDNVLSPRFTQRLKVEADARLPGTEDITLAKIAERFAPGARSVVVPPSNHHETRTAPILASSPGMRALVAVLIVVAWLPLVTFGAMSWLGLINMPWSAPMTSGNNESARPPVQTASVAAMPLSAREGLKQTAQISRVTLTAPITLEAKAGETLPLTLTIVRTDVLPARSSIAISGLPQGTTLSSGRPYGEREWNLRSDEISDLRLVVPNTASGEAKLRIDLIAPGGEAIANAETLLKVTAEPDASALLVRPRSSELPEIEVSDFHGVLVSATQDNSNNAPLALGASDFIIPSLTRAYGIKHEPREALGWSDQSQEVESSKLEAKPKEPEITKRSDEGDVQAVTDATRSWIELTEFVNLREEPSSSARVIGVLEKGSKLQAIERKRGWVKVTNDATSETGWIYARYDATIARSRARNTKAVGQETDDSFWTKLGEWVVGP